MRFTERGSGPALVLIPGLQGRWEYVRPAFEALSAAFRVITFPLCDEPSADFAFERARGFDNYVEQVRGILNQCGLERATVCGISFGGLIALRFAAMHPDRIASLVLTSTPGPGWHLRKRHEVYARLPYVFGPLFLAEMPWRLHPELAAALPSRWARLKFAASQCATLLRAPVSLARMARRGRMITMTNVAADCARITAPTLVVTGERELDHVVPVDGSTGYVSLIRGARGIVLECTGHLGSITHPVEFTSVVRDFVDRSVRSSTGSGRPDAGPQSHRSEVA